jgi:hypothetical protein
MSSLNYLKETSWTRGAHNLNENLGISVCSPFPISQEPWFTWARERWVSLNFPWKALDARVALDLPQSSHTCRTNQRSNLTLPGHTILDILCSKLLGNICTLENSWETELSDQAGRLLLNGSFSLFCRLGRHLYLRDCPAQWILRVCMQQKPSPFK